MRGAITGTKSRSQLARSWSLVGHQESHLKVDFTSWEGVESLIRERELTCPMHLNKGISFAFSGQLTFSFPQKALKACGREAQEYHSV